MLVRERPDRLADHSRIHAVSSCTLDIGADTTGLESGHRFGDSAYQDSAVIGCEGKSLRVVGSPDPHRT
ncbi:hypothetical protein GCM10027068_29000 [Prescottella soli]